MSTEAIINLIFDAGKGSIAVSTREGTCGKPYGELPVPTRKGYRFDGWYLDGTLITPETVIDSEEDVRLVARWTKDAEKKAVDRKVSMLKKQKRAVITLTAVALLLAIVFAIVAQLITIYSFVDTYTVDGVEYQDKYYIRKTDGTYKLYDKNGNLMETNGQSEDVFIARGSGNQYKIDAETGTYTLKAVVDAEDGEHVAGSNLLLFPQITSTYIYSIDVQNEKGSYRFYRTGDGVKIGGYEKSILDYDQELFAQLCFSCGYMLSTMKLDAVSKDSQVPRLPDGSIDYSVYGLDDPQAVYTVQGVLFEKNEDGSNVYENGKYVIDYDEDGNHQPDPDRKYTVSIGDQIVSKAGYYVRLEGRDSVYIVTTDYIGTTILQPLEALITPRAVFPVSVNSHSMGKNFYLQYLEEWTGEEPQGETIVAFTYSELEERINTMISTQPYNPVSSLMAGYRINDTSAIDVFGLFYTLECKACVKLGVTMEALKEFGLDKNVHYLSYYSDSGQVDEDGNATYVRNEILISQKTKDGTYYVASIPHDMIVEVDQYYLSFLEWDYMDWYDERFMTMNVAYLQNMYFQFGDRTYNFEMDNTYTYAYYLTYTTDENGNRVQSLKSINLDYGTVYQENGTQYYKTNSGAVYEIAAVIDFDTVTMVSNREVIENPDLENVIYVKENFYYINENKENVRVSPNYKDRTIECRDGKYYYVYQVNGKTAEIAVKRNLGDPIYHYKNGLEVTLSVSADNLLISCDKYNNGKGENKHVMDYSFTNVFVGDAGVTESETITGTDNFRRLHMKLLQFSLEGDINEAEFKAAMGVSVEEFLANPNNKPDASLTATVEDHAAHFNGYTKVEDGVEKPVYTENLTQRLVYKFYQYSDWKTLVTVELFEKDENGEWKTTAPDGVVGRFYVTTPYLEMLENDINRIINEQIVDSNSKV